ncbi:MAG: hypothetical protein U0Q12_07235 [Vicinamibacterales bacterium]
MTSSQARRRLLLCAVLALVGGAATTTGTAQRTTARAAAAPSGVAAATLAGLTLRNIGPAVTSGRVVSFAVHPDNPATYYVGAASGGVWKTTNAGASWSPVFDDLGSFSIGTVVLDPRQPSVVWVGTGENNSQRSVGYGDGVYRSDDGGRSWKRMGLEKSEHIARILIDPRDSQVVYVAAQGPLWSPGGDRGLYKTIDGGKTWKAVLQASENTGVTDVVVDPRNPDVLLAATYQRRRHFFTLIDGGPESAIYKTTDAGATWAKVTTGLPSVDLGRIGLAMSPANPDVVYATIEAADGKGGVFRSVDRGATWEKRNDFDSGAMYYGTVVADPVDVDRLYVMSVFLQVSDDGGRTLRNLGERFKHVDNHMIWIEPSRPDHYLVGCDGGIYESYDRGRAWTFKANLPVTQFYDIATDGSAPFYNIYGGTQDNFSLGGPSRTRSRHGILNQDWFVTQGGDGFQSRVDPEDPDTIYAESQHGGLVRFNRRTGERVGVQPQPGPGEPPLRWNWDTPVIISPHQHTRLYFGANRLYRSDDKGDGWRAVSADLTRQVDRDEMTVMGRIWGVDAVARHQSTAFYSNISALAESPLKEGLLFVGTDDGLVQVTEDGGSTWRRVDAFPGVPANTLPFVRRVVPSQHDAKVVYAAVDNHQNGDFTPYLLKSTDTGRTWSTLAGTLPPRGSVYAIVEDHVDPKLLFAGTEFGLFVTLDGGAQWLPLKGNFPTIAVHDLAIHKREHDLVVATFGRGIYVLDDYRPLRGLTSTTVDAEATLFPAKDALLYVPTEQYGLRDKAFQGESFFTGDNPPYGAIFTYHLKDGLKSLKERRQEADKAAERAGTAPARPTNDELRAEALEEPPAVVFTVTDEAGAQVRTITGPVGSGFHRVAWDLRWPPAVLPRTPPPNAEENLFFTPPAGPYALPGRYQVTMALRVRGELRTVAGPMPFTVVPDPLSPTTPDDRKTLSTFLHQALALERAVTGALEVATQTKARVDAMKLAVEAAPRATTAMKSEARRIERDIASLLVDLRGDTALASRNINVPLSIVDRVNSIEDDLGSSIARPTQTSRMAYEIAAADFERVLSRLRTLVERDVTALDKQLEGAGAPWTPGRLPEWKRGSEPR